MTALAAGFVLLAGLTWGLLSLAWPEAPVHVHVRWKTDVTEAERVALERRFRLTGAVHSEGTSWEYQLVDSSTANIRNIVQNARVDDTSHLNRIRYRPELAQDRVRQIWLYSLAVGGIGSLLLLALAVAFPRAPSFRPGSLSEFKAGLSPSTPAIAPTSSWRTSATALGTGALAAVAMTSFASAPLLSAAGALMVVYVGGYVAGSLLVQRMDGVSLAVIRTIAGLLLTTMGFLLSLVLSTPWFIGPGVIVSAAVCVRRRAAFAWPPADIKVGADGAAAALVAIVLLSPIAITFLYMAPGSFPPVFYNVDTGYFLEKVHALVAATSYPPESLSNVGIRRTYHYGTQAMAALVSRSSGLPPHQSTFLIVLPLLAIGVVAAAVAAARHVSPALPRAVAVPLLLISAPALSTPFWGTLGPHLWAAFTSRDLAFDRATGDYSLWGFLSNEGQNVGGDFLILGAVAGIAAARSWGWLLAAFLIGSAILVKTPVGIALFAGFLLAEFWRAVVAKRVWPSPQVLLASAVFAATCLPFFLISFESEYRLEIAPLPHLLDVVRSGWLAGFVVDVFWLFLPALIVVAAGITDPDKRSAPILAMAIAPIVIMNTTRLDNVSTGAGGTGGDWVQILHPIPFLLHAFALSLASRCWRELNRWRRTAVLVLMASVILPVTVAAARYSLALVRNPQSGHEFVDNRSLAAALSAVGTTGSMIVTNDLRYPAEGFARDDRQMQIPALFGHQAFAVNYAHEAVEERRALQDLLRQPDWSDAIPQAARTHHWTHLLIRKDYVHPTPIPLERVFENDSYAVYRFAEEPAAP